MPQMWLPHTEKLQEPFANIGFYPEKGFQNCNGVAVCEGLGSNLY